MSRPESDLDLFSDATLADPYPAYRELRAQGAAVWLKSLEMFALPRFAEVREALRNWQLYSSAHGAAMNQPVNQMIAGNTLGSDPPLHRQLRGVLERPLLPKGMQEVVARIEREAEFIAGEAVQRGRIEAVSEFATHLPVTVISHLVGLPELQRSQMLEWGNAAFNTLGPLNARCQASFELAGNIVGYAHGLDPASLRPDSWAGQLFAAARRGEISEQHARGMMLDYATPSLDTTISGVSSALWLFARHPEQWQLLRANEALLPGAINEVLRIESPVQIFSRHVTTEHVVDGVTLSAGSRALMMYGSANRDERKWQEPERFDIQRKANEQLAFGHGEHMCVGLPLARLEMKCLLTSLLRRVQRIELHSAEWALNNTLRGLGKLDLSFH